MRAEPEDSETLAATVAAVQQRPAELTERFAPGVLLASRYRIVSRLGKGGMGEVYRADDLILRQPVALKFLPESAKNNVNLLTRFYDEVRIARQISHKNVCRVYDIGESTANRTCPWNTSTVRISPACFDASGVSRPTKLQSSRASCAPESRPPTARVFCTAI